MDIYKRRWREVLGFRQKSLFSVCEICVLLKEQLSRKSFTMEQKLGALKQYRQHIHDQFADRTIIWALQSESGLANSNLLMVSTDGLDQAKFSLPREPQMRLNAALYLDID